MSNLSSDSDPAPDATIRRLRADLQRAREDADDLRSRLAYAEEEIRRLRAKIVGQVNQAAAPRET